MKTSVGRLISAWLCTVLLLGLVLPACQALAPTATPTPAEPTAQEIIAQSSDAMEKMNSLHFRLEVTGGTMSLGPGLTVTEIEGDVVKPDTMQVKTTMTFSGIVVNPEMRHVGGKTYLTNPITKKWETLPAGVSPLDAIDPFKGATILMEATDLAKLGKEALDGVEVYHLEGAIDAAAVAKVIGGGLAGDVVTAKVWVAVKDFVVHRVQLEIKASAEEKAAIVSTIYFSRFDEPITIEPPVD